MKLACKQFCSN